MKTNLILSLAAAAGFSICSNAAEYLSPEYLATSADGSKVIVTCATAKKLVTLNADNGEKIGEIALKFQPSGIAVAKDGSIYVAGGGVEGQLIKLDPNGKPLKSAEVGHTPIAPAVSPDGKTVCVANRFSNTVSFIDTEKMSVSATVKVLREPHALAFGTDGRLLFAANHLPYCKGTDALVAAAVSVINTADLSQPAKNILLPNGSTGVRGIAASPDGASIYVTHTFGRYLLPTTQLERGWMNTAALSVFDGTTGAYINTVLLDDIDLGAANPWGVAVSADNQRIAVAHSGTREVSVIDRAALHRQLEQAAKGEAVTEVTKNASDVPNDLSFLARIRKRYRFDGDGPRGVCFAGNRIFTSLYFADAVGKIDLAASVPGAELSRLGPEVDLTKDRVRRGEMLWNDGTMCFQHWQSCASCHPDARSDALNWDLLNDGIGNPKQSKSLIYCHLTPPAMVTGIRPGMKACNRKGITFIQFVVRPEEDGLCLDEYVMSLVPTPSPELGRGWFSRAVLSDAAKRGEKLFKQAGCAECHPDGQTGPNGEKLYTDMKLYDMGLGVGNEEHRKFDTPSLTECWRTAPYLYDGRALTIEEVLTECNPNDTHGKTKDLTPEQIKDLAAYIRSL